MSLRHANGWQAILADLALILFMVCASALVPAPAAGPGTRSAPPVEQATPMAIYRADPGAPPLAAWLGEQVADPRLRLTIVARYRPGERALALAGAEALARQAEAAGRAARLIVEPGEGGPAVAGLAFDAEPPIA